MKTTHHISVLSFLFFICFVSCKNNGPYSPDLKNVKGYVIGKETCNIDDTKDYWLIDLTFFPDTPQYGDTLVLNGITYTNAVKTKDLNSSAKKIGEKISIDFKNITSNKIETLDCNVSDPKTYKLKEIFIINQFEIR